YVREIVADVAKNNSLFALVQSLDEPLDVFFRAAQNEKRQPLGILVADSRQAFEFVDQLRDRLAVIKHFGFSILDFGLVVELNPLSKIIIQGCRIPKHSANPKSKIKNLESESRRQ